MVWEEGYKHSVWTDGDWNNDDFTVPTKTFLSMANYDTPPSPYYRLTQKTDLFGRCTCSRDTSFSKFWILFCSSPKKMPKSHLIIEHILIFL